MINHTPGPWNRTAIYCLLEFGRKQGGPWDDEELWLDDSLNMPDENDADLIALAPALAAACAKFKSQNAELLEALEKLTEGTYSLNELNENIAAARQVIAKVKGETG